MTVRLRVAASRMTLLVATAHLESGPEGEPLRRQQLAEVRTVLSDDAVDAALFAGDLNLREREDPETQGLGEDAWRLAGQSEHNRWTWHPAEEPPSGNSSVAGKASRGKQRFDRIFLQARTAVLQRRKPGCSTLELQPKTFSLLQSPNTDHCGVRCAVDLAEARDKQRQRRAQRLGPPLRAGARGRVGGSGVVRRPKKNET